MPAHTDTLEAKAAPGMVVARSDSCSAVLCCWLGRVGRVMRCCGFSLSVVVDLSAAPLRTERSAQPAFLTTLGTCRTVQAVHACVCASGEPASAA